MGKARSLLNNLGLFAVSGLATKFMVFVCLPLYTAFLTSEEYAVLDLSQTTVMILIPVLTVAVSDGIIRFVTKDQSSAISAMAIGVRLLLISCAVLLVALPLINFLFKSWFFSVLFVLFYAANAFTTLLTSYCRAVDAVRTVAIASVASAFVTLFLACVFIGFYNLGLLGYFASSIIGLLAGIALYLGRVGKDCLASFFVQVDKSLAKQIILYSLPLVPNAVFWSLSLNAGKYMLAATVGLSVAGMYSAASKLPSILSTFVSIFQQGWNLSVFREFDASEQNDGFSESVFQVYRFCNVVVAAVLIAACPYIAMLFLQGTFYDSWTYMPLLICSMYYSSMSTYYGSIFSAAMKTKSLFITTSVGAVINIVGCILLTPIVGVWGAVLSIVIANYFIYILRKIDVDRFELVDFKLSFQELFGFLLIMLALLRQLAESFVLPVMMCMGIVLLAYATLRFDLRRRGKSCRQR